MPDSASSGYIDSFSDELSLALGRAVWAFSAIELITHDYLRQLSTEPLHELMAGQSFRVRTRLVAQLLARIDSFPREKADATRYLKRAEGLAEIRNAIAHNPWQVWADFDLRELRAQIKPVRANSEGQTLESVRKFTAEAQEVATGLSQALRMLPYICNG